MEERLFWIGLAFGLYTWGTRYGVKTGLLDSRMTTAFWHALFCGMAGFTATMIVAMSIESRARFASATAGSLSPRELAAGAAGALIFGIFGLWRGWSQAGSAQKRKHYHAEDLEWAETVFSAFLLACVVMYFVVQAFKIPSGSMRSTLLEGDHLFVNKFIYGIRIPLTHKRVLRFRPLRRGDIVVFRFPTQDPEDVHCGSSQYGKDFIKRVIGLPGDEIQVKEGRVYVNGSVSEEAYARYDATYRPKLMGKPPEAAAYQQLWQEHRLDRAIGDVMRDYFGPVKVPEGSFFAMGDNRDHSCDSRFWGPVPEKDLKGKAWVVYWPPSRLGLVR